VKLQLIVEPCEDLNDACRNAQRFADACEWDVEFQFNSVLCIAKPGGDPELLADRQREASLTVPTVTSAEERK
jgi:hypothetical protein